MLNVRKVVAIAIAIGACAGNYDEELVAQVYGPRLDHEALCKLRMGSDGERFAEGWQSGTWSDDALSILGEPAERTRRTWFYDYCTSARCDKHALIELTFAPRPLCWRESGERVQPSEWLTDIRVEGMPYAECWDPARNGPERITCPECTTERDVVECESGGG